MLIETVLGGGRERRRSLTRRAFLYVRLEMVILNQHDQTYLIHQKPNKRMDSLRQHGPE